MSAAESQSRGSILTRRDGYRHWMRECVRWSDTDWVGHLNNLAFAAYCETGRCHFVRHLVEPGANPRLMLLPVQLVVNFLGEAHWPDEIDIGTGVLSIGRTSCKLGQGLFHGQRCIGSSETTMVHIDETTRRPQELPGWFRDWLGGYLIEDTKP